MDLANRAIRTSPEFTTGGKLRCDVKGYDHVYCDYDDRTGEAAKFVQQRANAFHHYITALLLICYSTDVGNFHSKKRIHIEYRC